jgi:hypothetical protein
MSVLPRSAYYQGVPKTFLKTDKFEFAWPEFANIGEQEIATSEIFQDYDGAIAYDYLWGYQARYAEYKLRNDSCHGDFRENLDFWHMGRKFTGVPGLNYTFVGCDPTTRVFAVQENNPSQLMAQVYHKVKAIRPLPIYGIPSI